jgi:hypothetical protein
MQWFGTAYTRRFNLGHYQSGHLFQGRFKSVTRDSDPVVLLNKASKLLQCDLERIINSPRVRESDKLNRDILLYLLWQEGKYTNEKIGNILGLTHSAVSRRVSITRKKMEREKGFNERIKDLKSQIKP